MWTMDELVDRVRRALAAEYSGAPNGRVRDLPDRRAIRWYTTIGLVDRPLGLRGRTALYGPRHLLQLVALKRRQAEGRTLAEIQAELAGAEDAALTALARVPDELLTTDGPPPDHPDGGARTRFWATPPTPGSRTPPRVTDRSDRAPASPLPPAGQIGGVALGDVALGGVALGGVALGGGAILVLPVIPSAAERAAIAAAAEPLLALLADRGLLTSAGQPDPSPPRPLPQPIRLPPPADPRLPPGVPPPDPLRRPRPPRPGQPPPHPSVPHPYATEPPVDGSTS